MVRLIFALALGLLPVSTNFNPEKILYVLMPTTLLLFLENLMDTFYTKTKTNNSSKQGAAISDRLVAGAPFGSVGYWSGGGMRHS
jgi:hypothetical protein